jgi:transposase
MLCDASGLPDNVDDLREIIVSLKQEYETQISLLHEQIRHLRSKLFGRKSETYVEGGHEQVPLFDEVEQIASSDEDTGSDEITVPAHKRKKRGRKPLPEALPRVEVIHDLPEDEKVCACGSQLSKIGEEVSEKLDYIPAKLQVIRHIRYKYACKSCEGVETEAGAVKTAPPPAQIIPKGIATPGLLAHILVSKFCDALPFYRQTKIFQRLGIEIPRATMANWAIQVARQCQPLLELLHTEVLSGPLVNIDETTVQVLKEPGRSNTSQSYMWIFRGGPPDKPALVYQYHPSRSGQVPRDYLKDYRGFVQTDGYSGYDALGLEPGIVHVGCWAHARRKFFEVVQARQKNGRQKSKTGSGDVALSYIGKLYRIESIAKEQEYPAEQIRELRQEQARPILDEFRAWLEKRLVETPPKGLLGQAISYTLNQWHRLIRYLDDGRLRPDNNLAENAIRPFVVGRKNWLFSGHPRGANASASLYSLIETAKANRFEPYLYLRFLFSHLPMATTTDDYKSLLPQYLDRGQYLHASLSAVY